MTGSFHAKNSEEFHAEGVSRGDAEGAEGAEV